MNLLRESTFFDRDRNAQIELDDLIEETSSTADTKPTSFYLILYFSADWLPDVSNNQLNERLRSFMDTIRSKTASSSSAVELVFVSSDKTSDSYWNFLYKFKFIRYSLAFHEKDLKTQLCNYFNVNGIPYMTLIELKLDTNLKIVDFRSDKRNIKHDFLADPNALKFPWFKETTTISSQPKPTTTMTDENNAVVKSSDETAVTIKASTDDNKTISPPVNKSKIRDINEIFEEKDDDKILYMEENEEEEDEEKNSTTASETAAENPILREIFENLEPSNEAVRLLMTTDLDRFLDEKKFIFLLVGSPQLKTNPTIVQSIAEFWKRYQKKHKFFVIYTEFNSDSTAIETAQTNNNKSSLLSVDLSNVDWFFISKMDVKINICKHYGVNSVPKLLVVDRETGDLLNNTLKMCLIEYVHEFFNSLQQNENENNESEEEEDEEEYDENIEASSTNKQEEAKPEEPWKPPQPPPPPPPPPPVQQSVLIAKEDTTTTNEDSAETKGCLKSPLLWRNFNLNFDLDAYDIFDNYRHHGKSHHHRHHHHHHQHNQPHRHHRNHHRGDNTHRSAHRSRNDNSTASTTAVAVTTTTTVSSSSRSKRKLNRCLIDELNANLIEVCPASVSTIGNVGAASQGQLPLSKNYYLLYFCSFFTSSNGRQKALFEQIIEFLRYVQEKIECSIKIILVSSDFLETDYHKLVDKYRVVDTIPDQEHGNFGRYVLDFRSKAVKERLFQKLHVTGIPWFSLIDADSGEILCENLKIFILNSQLREMIF